MRPAPSLLGRGRCPARRSLLRASLWGCGNAPFPSPGTLVPSALRAPRGEARLGPARPRRRRVPGSVTPAGLWGLGPPRRGGRPPSRLPCSAHAKACCVIPTWADIPCPGRSGVGLLIILSAADPRHQPIYCPVSPRWFREGGGQCAQRRGGHSRPQEEDWHQLLVLKKPHGMWSWSGGRAGGKGRESGRQRLFRTAGQPSSAQSF